MSTEDSALSSALSCEDQASEHGDEVPVEVHLPPEDQAANDLAVPNPLPEGDDVNETASVVDLVPETEEPDRPVTPPGREQDLEALKESVNRIVGAMDTLLRQIPGQQEMPMQPVGHDA